MTDLSVKENQVRSNGRARSSERCEKPLCISYHYFSAKDDNPCDLPRTRQIGSQKDHYMITIIAL